ncbi:MAG: hypothetical protein JW894_12535 [Bacteroidales bacterium]|nr:hypothetical protein [Bacteroidales bacterium]
MDGEEVSYPFHSATLIRDFNLVVIYAGVEGYSEVDLHEHINIGVPGILRGEYSVSVTVTVLYVDTNFIYFTHH